VTKISILAIARWNNEGGAPGPSKRGTNALIPMRYVDLNQYGPTLVQKDAEFHYAVAETEASNGAWRRRKHRLGNRVADAPASTSYDDSEKEIVTQAAQGPSRIKRYLSVSYDLWRFSCEMPDAPRLCNNSTPP
jgi:hypothetical protein